MAEQPRGERLQKVLSRAGIASRRAAEDLIREGRVTIDGRVAVLGDRVAAAGEPPVMIRVDGEPVRQHGPSRYILLNKPAGYVTTRSDPEGRPTVMDLIPERWRRRLKPVGRLDYGTEGLLLLTDDGDLAYRVTHPSFGCSKRYFAKVRGLPGDSAIARLRGGMVIAGRRTAPMRLARAPARRGARPARASSWWQIELVEGRTRQIREMFFRVGHPVQRLRRVAIGRLEDTELPLGAWRELAADELTVLRTGPGPRPGRGAPGPRRRQPRRRKPRRR
ncbi:MAG: rRNA pseudouridine synthase [Holophagales bacterium]|nr:rRNA pseudouridine synthase [Holophagales bacterium]MYC11199.1 rRNA pseudouridine synthase [Holophagales bacterium]